MRYLLSIFGCVILVILVVSVINKNEDNKLINQCRSSGGQPVTDRGFYKFCLDSKYIIEINK